MPFIALQSGKKRIILLQVKINKFFHEEENIYIMATSEHNSSLSSWMFAPFQPYF